MRTFTLFEPLSEKAAKVLLEKKGFPVEKIKGDFPQEDFLLVSEKHPIFVVADGVTLSQFLIGCTEDNYPRPSPAGDAARIFCEALVKAAEEKYENFELSDIPNIFRTANNAVGEYNKAHGRTKEALDHWDIDLYAATASFVVVKNEVAYWGSICDSYVMHFDKNGILKMSSPLCKTLAQAKAPEFEGDQNDQKERTRYTWKIKRNGVNEKRERVGYGVATGEPEALLYLASGSFALAKGDIITLLSDGFEDYMKLPEFTSLLARFSDDLEQEVKAFTAQKADEDPDKFGHERSLIVVSAMV